jgi:hypothetical protein
MLLFSQREGFKLIKNIIQYDSIDDDLRNGLWNALYLFYWSKAEKSPYLSNVPLVHHLCKKLWVDYFKYPLDTLNKYWEDTYRKIRNYFFSCPWYEVYDFIEFVANNYPT